MRRRQRSGRNRLSTMTCLVGALAMAVLAVVATTVSGQPGPSEHDSHHPGRGGPPGGEASAPAAGMGMSGMGDGGGMESMMERMGVPPPRELYPEMMRLERPSAEQRARLIDRARTRRLGGAVRLSRGLEELDRAVTDGDRSALSEALGEARAGLDELESGLAAEQALDGDQLPAQVALEWFKGEMDLDSGRTSAPPTGLGVSWFHAFVMTVLSAFSIAMVGMYFHKMRRASWLLEELGQAEATPTPPEPSFRPPDPPPAVERSTSPTNSQVSSLASHPVLFEALRKTGSCGSCKSPCATRVRVAQIIHETPDVKTFRLCPLDEGPLPFEYLPGQFLNVVVPSSAGDGGTTKRSYTISSAPTQATYCEITVKREPAGEVSRILHETLQEGDELRIAAPYGRFTFTGEEADSIVLIGCGVGITPLMSVIRYLTDHSWGGEIVLVYGFRTPADFLFGQELELLARRHPNLSVVPTVSSPGDQPWEGREGRIDARLVREVVPEIARRLVHICGPKSMMDATREFLIELGVPKDRIRFESFGGVSAIRPPIQKVPESQVSAPHEVSFSRSQKSGEIGPDLTILDVAESLDVEIEWSCRAGTCGSCTVKLLEGEVEMEVDEGLDSEDRDAGLVLACQARATSDIVVEA